MEIDEISLICIFLLHELSNNFSASIWSVSVIGMYGRHISVLNFSRYSTNVYAIELFAHAPCILINIDEIQQSYYDD